MANTVASSGSTALAANINVLYTARQPVIEIYGRTSVDIWGSQQPASHCAKDNLLCQMPKKIPQIDHAPWLLGRVMKPSTTQDCGSGGYLSVSSLLDRRLKPPRLGPYRLCGRTFS